MGKHEVVPYFALFVGDLAEMLTCSGCFFQESFTVVDLGSSIDSFIGI